MEDPFKVLCVFVKFWSSSQWVSLSLRKGRFGVSWVTKNHNTTGPWCYSVRFYSILVQRQMFWFQLLFGFGLCCFGVSLSTPDGPATQRAPMYGPGSSVPKKRFSKLILFFSTCAHVKFPTTLLQFMNYLHLCLIIAVGTQNCICIWIDVCVCVCICICVCICVCVCIFVCV